MNVDDRLADAKDRDRRDCHLSSRDRFHIPPGRLDQTQTYLLGNSLGLQPKTTERVVLEELRKWRTLGAAAHFQGAAPWMPYHELVTQPLADIVGARPDEVVAMNSLTVNLHLLLATFYAPAGVRQGILMERNPFPSDYHAITTYLCHCGRSPSTSLFTIEPDPSTLLFSTEQICERIARLRDQLALIVLPGVHYYTGQVLDIRHITEVAHGFEIPIGWDLAHAVGNIPLELHGWDVDFAVWCSYKYLNSGPGAVGGAFIHQRHANNKALPRLAGWWGHDKATRFQMQPVFDPIPTAEGWQLSNPPILAMAPLRSSLDEFGWAGGMAGLRTRSELLIGYLEARLRDELGDTLQQLTPLDPTLRGSQLSLRLRLEGWKEGGISSARALVARLEELDIVVDAREPDVVRVCLAPLYNTFEDAHRFVEALREIVPSSVHLESSRGVVPSIASSSPPSSAVFPEPLDGLEKASLLGKEPRPLKTRSVPQKQEMLLIGAGLVGTLVAFRLARRGYRVNVIEKRPDLRVATISAGRSINLALAERGRAALRKAGLLERIERGLVAMSGRMLHQLSGETQFQPYGQAAEEVIYSVPRGELNRILLSAAEEAGVGFHFEEVCEDLDLRSGTAKIRDIATGESRLQNFRRVLGADGASSVVRDAILKGAGTRSALEELGHGYKELTIPADPDGAFLMEPHALHVWPRGGFMLIALPNCDGSFTVTLFLPHSGEGSDNFAALTSPSEIMAFFERHFPDVVPLIPSLAETFLQNQVGQLATLKCWPWHAHDRALILGDAAHAIVPFHGQGMNCGFEDCDALIDLLDEYSDDWRKAMPEFAAQRKPNADAIADLALKNYLVMRDQVRDPKFALRQAVEFELERRFPQQYIPRYAMVMFHHVPYALAMLRSERQDAMLRDLVAKADSFDDFDFTSAVAWIRRELAPLPGLADWKQQRTP